MRNALSAPFFVSSFAVVACCLCCLAVFAPACAPALAADTAGTVMVATPGAFVKRGGEQMPLKVKDTVQVGDTLVTDATGRVRVWMRDDTTISLGANSHFTLEAYSAAGSKPQLKGAMTGLARLLTGKIAKANPEGTVVSTPLASVGIRGTICTIEASREMTRVAVESCPTDVLVNGVPLVSGQLGIVRQAGGAPQITPLPQDLRRELGGQVAANRMRPASASVAAAGTPGVRGLAPVTTSPAYAAMDIALNEKAGELFRPVEPTPTPPVLPLTGTVTANLTLGPDSVVRDGKELQHAGFDKSSLQFAVDLMSGSGAISSARLHGVIKDPAGTAAATPMVVFDISDGTGTVNKGSITIDNWKSSSPVHFNGDTNTYADVSGKVSGTLKFSGDAKAVTDIKDGAYAVQGTSSIGSYVRVSGGINNVTFKGK